MDRKWWLRLALLAIIVAFVLLIGRATILAFAPEHTRLERAEERMMGRPPVPSTGSPNPAP